MKLSLITINFNNSEGLRKTIHSVLGQTFTDFEYIIIDGGSDDGSIDVIHEYNVEKGFKNQICYWVSELDTGIYNAMNKGIKVATGEYLLFLNSGDYLVCSELLTQVFQIGFFEDIAVGNCNISRNEQVIYLVTPPDEISFAAFYGRTIPHQASFIRKTLFEKLGLFNENFRIHSDLDFFTRALIINNCTYRHIPLTISDYNLEGLSSSDRSMSISEEEYKSILKSLLPPRVLYDYAQWGIERKALEPLYWAKTKQLIYNPILWIYNFAAYIVSLKKRALNK